MQSPLRTVFFGSDPIVLPLLDYLRQEPKINLQAVVTQPDKAIGRGKKIQPNRIKTWGLENNTEVLQPEKPGSNEVKWLEDNKIDLLLVMAYGHILKKDLLEHPQYGIYNYHASLLPAYRGASPIESVLASGEKQTGVTFMEIAPKMDTGDIIATEVINIDETQTTETLSSKIAQACIPLTQKILNPLINKTLTKTQQQESQATYTRKIVKEDGQLDFNQTAEVLERRIRALTPWPGSFFEIESIRYKIGSARIIPHSENVHPGSLLKTEEFPLIITTSKGALAIGTLQRPGGKMLPIEDFLRGHPLPYGFIINSQPMQELVSNQVFKYKPISNI